MLVLLYFDAYFDAYFKPQGACTSVIVFTLCFYLSLPYFGDITVHKVTILSLIFVRLQHAIMVCSL